MMAIPVMSRSNVLIFAVLEEKIGTASKMVQWLLFSVRSSFFAIKEVINNRSVVQFQSTYSAFPALIAKIILRATVVGDDVVLIHSVDRQSRF